MATAKPAPDFETKRAPAACGLTPGLVGEGSLGRSHRAAIGTQVPAFSCSLPSVASGPTARPIIPRSARVIRTTIRISPMVRRMPAYQLTGPVNAGRSAERPEKRLEPGPVRLAVERVRRVGIEVVLAEAAAPPHVDRGVDRAVAVHLDRDRNRVLPDAVHEVLEREDAVVADPRVREGDDAREVALLDPELGRAPQLREQVGNERLRPQDRTRPRVPETLGDVPGEDARVVAEAVHRGGVRGETLFLQARRSLGRVPCEEDAWRGDALPERRLRRDAAVAGGRDAELGQVAQCGAEAGRDDHLLCLEIEVAGPRRALGPDDVAGLVPLDALDRRVDDERARPAPDVLLVRLQVADSKRRAGQHAEAHRPRRDEDDLPRPRQQAVRELETRAPLADDDQALAAVRGGLLRLDVVRRVLLARDPALPRLGDPDGEHRGRAPVLAVAGREHEAVVVSSCALPAAAVADEHAGALGEGLQPSLHLGPRGNVERAVHIAGDERAVRRVLGEQAVVIVGLVLARARLERCVRLRPTDQAVEDRKAAEHPARRVVGRHQRVRDAVTAEVVGGLEPAGAAADDDDLVPPRWMWAAVRGAQSPAARRSAAMSRRASAWKMR